MKSSESTLPTLLGIILGGLVSLGFLLVAHVYSIHASRAPTQLFFPYAVSIFPELYSNVAAFIVLAVGQWLLYGGILGAAWARSGRNQSSSKMLMSLVVTHCVALAVAIYRVESLPLIKYSSESMRVQMGGAI